MKAEELRKRIEAANSCIRLFQNYVEQLKAGERLTNSFQDIVNAAKNAIDTDFRGF